MNADTDDTDDSRGDGQPLIQPWKDPDRLRELYHGDGLTQAEIAERFGIDDSTVSYWFKQFDIDTGYNTRNDGGHTRE